MIFFLQLVHKSHYNFFAWPTYAHDAPSRSATRMRTHTRITAMQSTHPCPNVTVHKITSTHNHYECCDCALIYRCTRELWRTLADCPTASRIS